MEAEGRVGVIVPHGVLFRGGTEGTIRKALIEENLLEAVIGSAAEPLLRHRHPGRILLFNKGKTTTDVLFIDASHDFVDDKKQNRLSDQNIADIVSAFGPSRSKPKYAHRATLEEIRENDFNLNIARYVDTSEDEQEDRRRRPPERRSNSRGELSETRRQMAGYLKELGLARSRMPLAPRTGLGAYPMFRGIPTCG